MQRVEAKVRLLYSGLPSDNYVHNCDLAVDFMGHLDREYKRLFIHLVILSYLLSFITSFVSVVADLKNVVSVEVQDQDMKYGKTGHIVVFTFREGYSISATESATSEDIR